MEKDVNIIIDVEPEEAGQLIGLIEMLVHDWYIIRYERQEQLKAMMALAEAKNQAKNQPPVEEGTPDPSQKP